MAAEINSVWAVDLGNNSLKAMRLSNASGVLEVLDFDVIEHGKILAGRGVEELEKQELIALTLRQFLGRHSLDKDPIIISLPSQNSFARFVNLPPVEAKKIPEIIRFEAVQQIPFDINDVQWDYQLMEKDAGGENRVGIFAIKNDVINSTIEHFQREDIQIRYIQMSPMAIYNYAVYDRTDMAGTSADEAIVILNIGAEYTDLVVCTKSGVWQRCIPVGGNAFTKAVSDAFKIPFEKAEKLKRNATSSKYARQILQAMKPVFSNFASEIQRSIGFYSSSNPRTKLVKMVAMGGGTRMRGLLKYLQQSIQMPIDRPDSFEKISLAAEVSAAKFHDCLCDLAIVYGLGVQALGMAKIESNLLPRNITRSFVWAGKAKFFYAAAFVLMFVSALAFLRVMVDRASWASKNPVRAETETVIKRAQTAKQLLRDEQNQEPQIVAEINKEFELFNYRDVIPSLMQTILSALPNKTNNTTDKEQLKVYTAFDERNIKALSEVERSKRKQIFITDMSIRFVEDVSTASFDEAARTGGTIVAPVISVDPEIEAMKAKMKADQEFFMQRFGGGGGQQQPVQETEPVIEPTTTTTQTPTVKSKAGFVVTIIGYTPYKEWEAVLAPLGVGNDINRWGFITKLKNINQFNPVFELFDANSTQHFTYQVNEVASSEKRVPAGIGVLEQRTIEVKKDNTQPTVTSLLQYGMTGNKIVENILVDPMTREIIDKVKKYDENGQPVLVGGTAVQQINDHWFEIKAKFIWKDVPQQIAARNKDM
jgi:type IV pilus assembly protein PilM